MSPGDGPRTELRRRDALDSGRDEDPLLVPLPGGPRVRSAVSSMVARLRARDRLQIERMGRFEPLAKQLSDNEDGLALLAMLLHPQSREYQRIWFE